ncbi:MAG: hypothetical protein QOI55_2982 [Actinomycetota bacterium]|jgi:hypothetical protein|nr:hypothetical protein [Actinomycetota bacterium]
MPAEDRTPVERDYHTDELPPTPQRDYMIPATRWVEAPAEVRALGEDLGVELVAYLRRIGRYLLWRTGPATRGDARYMAINAADFDDRWTFRLFPDGTGDGSAPDGTQHTRFRTWKEALRDWSNAEN